MTVYEYFKSFDINNVDDLAIFLDEATKKYEGRIICPPNMTFKDCFGYDNCKDCFKDWLNSEIEEK